MTTTPTPEDRFSFGLWTVGWQGVDPFGGAVRPPIDPVESVKRLAELGAWGITFHDDDLIPFGSDTATRDKHHQALPGRARRDRDGRADGDHEHVLAPAVQGRRLHLQRPRRAPLRAAQGHAQHGAGRHLGAKTYVFWGGREGSEYNAAKDIRAALDRYREGLDFLAAWSIEQGFDLRFAIEPKPNEPRGDILLPTVGHALAFIEGLEHADMVGVNPEVGHEEMSNLNFSHEIAQALWQGKLFHIDLNGQKGPKFDQDLVFGHGDLLSAFALVDLLENGAPGGRADVRRPAPLRLQAGPHGDRRGRLGHRGVQHEDLPRAEGARGGLPRGPRGPGGARTAGVADLRDPTLADGETAADLLADRSAFEDFDTEAAGERGYGFVRLHQLAIEHLLGARGGEADGAGRRRRLVDAVVQGASSATRRRVSSPGTGPPSTPRGRRSTRGVGRRAAGGDRPAGGLDDVAAVAVGAQQHGMVYLDATARSSGRRCCGTTPARRAPRTT